MAQKVKVDGKYYPSCQAACDELDIEVGPDSAHRKLDEWARDNPGHIIKYIGVQKELPPSLPPPKKGTAKAVSVKVDGKQYPSCAAACRDLGIKYKGDSAHRVLKRWARDNPGHQVAMVTPRPHGGFPPVIGPERPIEQLDQEQQQQQLPIEVDIKQRLLSRLLATQPPQFENVVGRLLKVLGLQDIHVTGTTADGGIDGDATMPLLGVRVGFQAKRWQTGNNVAAATVRELIGSVTRRGYDRGIFITTSDFTAGAHEEADSPNSKVVLINGERLVDIMLEKGIGVKKVPVVNEEIDERFFEEL